MNELRATEPTAIDPAPAAGRLGAMSGIDEATVDGELVVRVRRGDAAAGEELARRHRNAAYLFALQLTGNPDDALDLSQEAMLRFFTHIDRFDTTRPVRPWLFTVVRNRARDNWRKKKNRKTDSLINADGENLLDRLGDNKPGPAQRLAANELRRRIWRCLAKLSRVQREILVLRDYHDLTYAEIAGVLAIPQGTVMSRLHAARTALRRTYLEDQGADRV